MCVFWSGYTYYRDKYGEMFSYERAPRSQIFRRDQAAVQTTEDMKRLMNYNDWKHDPISQVEALGGGQKRRRWKDKMLLWQAYPGEAISARFDIKGGPEPDPLQWWYHVRTFSRGDCSKNFMLTRGLVPQGLHGGMDSKITSFGLFTQRFGSHIISGPTHDQQPPFTWADWAETPHLGMPETYNFSWQLIIPGEDDGV
jgi:hypothetical protein